MCRTARSIVIIVTLVVALAAAASAQTPAPPAGSPPAVAQMDRSKLRRYIYTMEGALAKAVEYGAKDLNRKIRSAIPEIMALSGEPQARGVYLEGYGIYFDVAVPVLNQVMIASWGRMLGPDDGVVTALLELKSYIKNEKNPATRASIQAMLERLEMQLGPLGAGVATQDAFAPVLRPTPGTSSAPLVGSNTSLSASPPPGSAAAATTGPVEPRFDRKYFQDLNAINRAYTESVQNALIDTLIDQALPTAVKADEFLTIAARDNMQRDSLSPFDPWEEVVTILLRVKGSDLAAYRAGQIDAVELRKRIEVREF
jgi:hypothetical protein